MKTIFKQYGAFLPIAIVMAFFSCHSGPKDSTEIADSANEKRIDKSDSTQKASKDLTLSANKTLQEDASKFLVNSYESGMYEIQLSQLATKKGLDTDVKNLAALLVAGYNAINEKMDAIAANANFILPATITTDHQKSLQDMGKLTGADFDKKYIDEIVSGHENFVSNYKDAYKNLAESNTKNFAAETLPKIEDYLAIAKKVQDRIK